MSEQYRVVWFSLRRLLTESGSGSGSVDGGKLICWMGILAHDEERFMVALDFVQMMVRSKLCFVYRASHGASCPQ